MSEQPNALKLAKWLDAMPSSGYALPNQAATELRRLHEEVNEQARLLGMSADRELALLAKIDRLERQLETPLYTSPQPARRKPLTDDPLQGAVDWLLEADGEYFCTATVQRTLRIGYNRAKRLCDTAKERAAHGIKGDA